MSREASVQWAWAGTFFGILLGIALICFACRWGDALEAQSQRALPERSK